MRTYKWAALAVPAAAVILELLPYGAVLNFGEVSEEGGAEVLRATYSYFSLVPFGYANFGPFVAAVLTCVMLILAIVYLISGNKKWRNALKNVSGVAFFISLTPLLFGPSYVSAVGVLISVALFLEMCVAVMIKD